MSGMNIATHGVIGRPTTRINVPKTLEIEVIYDDYEIEVDVNTEIVIEINYKQGSCD